METPMPFDVDAIRRACERHGVERLRVFGSVLTEYFDPETSDIDFLVEFQNNREDLFGDYFDLKLDLEQIVGRNVDLVLERSVKNPFLRKSVFRSAQGIYAV